MQKICPECGGELREKSGVSKKTGNPYSFIGCSNYPSCRYIEKENMGFQPAVKKEDGTAILMDELQAFRKEFNERMDSMGQWLTENIIKTIEK